MKKAPRQIIAFLQDPTLYDRKSFETAVRNEVELSSGDLSPTQELLMGMLIMQVETLLQAHAVIMQEGYAYEYHSGTAQSVHIKTRTEALDKAIKVLKELNIAKVKKATAEVNELFETA